MTQHVEHAHPLAAPGFDLRAKRPAIFRWGLIALLLVGVAALVARWAITRRETPPVRYESAVADRGAIAARVTATGTLSPLVTVIVGSQVSGRIAELHADFGSEVKKGQVIATIDPALFRAAVSQAKAKHTSALAVVGRAKARLAQAEKDWVRAKNLHEEGLQSRQDYDAVEAALGTAKAELQAAIAGVSEAKAELDKNEQNLRYTEIHSPIDGTVISRNVDVGQTVAATLQAPTLFTIAKDLKQMQVDTSVAEADVGKIRAGLEVTFTVDAYPARPFAGRVRQVRDNATTVQNVVTYDAVIDVDNAEGLLKPGMTANVTFVYAKRDDALVVPNAALRFKPDAATLAAMGVVEPPALRPSERAIWVLRGDRAELVVIEIGISDGIVTEVVSGDLRPGDRIVVEAIPTDKPKRAV